jgi:anti-anti-sigma factor
VVVVVGVSGDIDASNASDLAVLTRIRLERASSLILDLSGVDFIGAAGFWVLWSIKEHCIAAGPHLAVVASAAVTRLLDVCDPSHTLQRRPDVDAALLAVSRRHP